MSLPHAWAAAAPTATTLTITSSGSAVTSVASGTVVTLTATVVSGTTPVTPGQVNFCDATAKYCTDIHLIAIAQLTSAGTATYKFRPGGGNHSYQAVFVGTSSYAKSASSKSMLNVPYSTTTTIASSGSIGNYTLTATVAGVGSRTLGPTGDVSFLDATNGNESLGTAALGTATPGTNNFTTALQSILNESYWVSNVTVGDFNGDGIPDLAAVNQYTYTLSVLLGNGDGTFTLKSSPSVGNDPISIAAGDFNGDGIPDLAVANSGDNTVTVLLGNGDGTFTTRSTPAVGNGPDSIAVGDFNGDGIPDLAVANGADNTVTVLLGNGDGTFTLKSSPGVGSVPSSIVVGDFNGDGIPDLATANCGACTEGQPDDTVTVLLGNGDGTFTLKSSPTAGNAPDSLAVGDFNGDGILDLAVSDLYGLDSTVTVLLGNGDGTFTTGSTLRVGTNAASIAVADFNQDGIPDLATVTDTTITMLLGNGDGTFTTGPTPSLGSPASGLAVADFNGDGTPDLAIPLYYSATVTVLLNQNAETATATLSDVSVPSAAGETHQVAASYPGVTNFSPSISSTIPLLAAQIVTTLTLTSSPNPSPFNGYEITLTATLNPYSFGSFMTNGETVTFYNGGAIIGTGTLSSGVATLNIATLPPGTDSLTAVYTSDDNFAGATSNSVAQLVNAAPFPPFIVTVNTDDATGVASNCTGAGSSNCSLRDALGAATAAGAGNITFAPTVSGITLSAPSGSLYIPSNTTITGPAGGVTVSGLLGGSILYVNSGVVNVAVSNLGVTGNDTIVNGGGIYNGGQLTVTNSSISGNNGEPGLGATGVGIYNAGTMTLINSNVSGNDLSGPGTSFGGGIFNAGTLMVINSSISNNDVSCGGGGCINYAGGIYNGGTLILTGSTIQGNEVFLPTYGAGILNRGILVATNTNVTGNIFDGGNEAPPEPTTDDNCDGSGCLVNGVNGNTVGGPQPTQPAAATPVFDPPAGSYYVGKQGQITDTTPGAIIFYSTDGEQTWTRYAGPFTLTGTENLAAIAVAANYTESLVATAAYGIEPPAATPVLTPPSGTYTTPQMVSISSASPNATIYYTTDGSVPGRSSPIFNPMNPISVSSTEIIKAYAVAPGYGLSLEGWASYKIIPPYAPTPTFSLAAGFYDSSVQVMIMDSLAGATIHYTTDHSTPTASSPVYGGGPITISTTERLQAIVTAPNYSPSAVAQSDYYIAAAEPVFSKPSGTYSGPQMVTISDATPGALIYYTTNGTVPSRASATVSPGGSILVSTSETVKALAVATGYTTSPEGVATYTITPSP